MYLQAIDASGEGRIGVHQTGKIFSDKKLNIASLEIDKNEYVKLDPKDIISETDESVLFSLKESVISVP